ncbi:ABC transporter substrate-binding protein, partial [Brucella abortus]
MKKMAFAALFGAVLSFASSAEANDKLKLILDWYVNPDHGPIIIANKLGYFRQAGLDVDIVAPADASVPTKMVAAGQADLAVSYQQQ